MFHFLMPSNFFVSLETREYISKMQPVFINNTNSDQHTFIVIIYIIMYSLANIQDKIYSIQYTAARGFSFGYDLYM